MLNRSQMSSRLTPNQISHSTRLLVQNEIRLLSSEESEYKDQLDDMLRRGIQGAAVENMISCILTAARTKAGLIEYLENSAELPAERAMVASRRGQGLLLLIVLVLLFAALMLAVGF